MVALRASAEQTLRGNGHAAPLRTLLVLVLVLVLVANADGGFVEAVRNTRVIFKADEGGQCDPFLDSDQGLVAKGAYFTVQNGLACGQHWTDCITLSLRPPPRRCRVPQARDRRMGNEHPGRAAADADALRLSEHEEIAADPGKPVLLSAYTPAT
ncbi:Secreted protein [Xanthomonas citri pv. bilvae]|nr:Secreted protein [Xanthomonas citri pv. bilvae]